MCTVFGSMGIAMVAAGAYFDWKAYKYLAKAEDASDSYDGINTRNQTMITKEKDRYELNRKYAKKQIIYRNIIYGAAGVCLGGFYLSFVF